jgi:hypothetical protein
MTLKVNRAFHGVFVGLLAISLLASGAAAKPLREYMLHTPLPGFSLVKSDTPAEASASEKVIAEELMSPDPNDYAFSDWHQCVRTSCPTITVTLMRWSSAQNWDRIGQVVAEIVCGDGVVTESGKASVSLGASVVGSCRGPSGTNSVLFAQEGALSVFVVGTALSPSQLAPVLAAQKRGLPDVTFASTPWAAISGLIVILIVVAGLAWFVITRRSERPSTPSKD